MHPSPNPLIKLAPSSSLSTKKVPVIGLSVGLEVHRPVICPIPKLLITLSPNANPLTKMVSVVKVGVDKGVNHPMISPNPNLLIKPTPSPNPLTKKIPVGELSAGLGVHHPVICPIPNSLIARDAVSTVHPGTRLPASCVATLYSPPDVPCQPHGVDTQLVVGDLAQKPCYSKATTSMGLVRDSVPRPLVHDLARVEKCGIPSCILCPILLTYNQVTSRLSRRKHYIYGHFTCQTRRLVYLIQCVRCHKQYVGQTVNEFAQRAHRH